MRIRDKFDGLILELKCLGEVAEFELMTVEGNHIAPLINDAWKAIEKLQQAQSGEAVATLYVGDEYCNYHLSLLNKSSDEDIESLRNKLGKGIHQLFTNPPKQSGEAVAYIDDSGFLTTDPYEYPYKSFKPLFTHSPDQSAKIAELEADKKRLDWMIFHSASIHHSKDGDDCWIKWFDGEELRESTKNFQNAREAIDEAKGDGE